ncbi:dockerin type I domain-containing protein [Flavobacterium sp.]|uniref:dockerin type I domain-containing protein n=1 Tax=Flavobacterium sp. TaxID=239 RepID=UPI00262F5B1A|nr:dockerin type I domain-containing protein [Flavobacterium sp.]
MKKVNLKFFVQSYYKGNGTMESVKFNQDGISPADEVEEVKVGIWAGATLVEEKTGMLKIDGNVTVQTEVSGGNNYVSVVGKNSLRVYTPVALDFGNDDVDYDFTIAAEQAAGANQIEVESGVFALYSGDVNQDGVIDDADEVIIKFAAENSQYGIAVCDLNGDGVVDNSDTDNFWNNKGKAVILP